jgi:hypothetical protein
MEQFAPPANTQVGYISEDTVAPSRLEHLCDQIIFDGKIEQQYNFLSYEFVCDDMLVCARAYLDDISEVSLFGPYRRDLPPENQVPLSVAFPPSVLAYLQRRYRRLKILGADGYETLWQHPRYQP